MDGSRCPGDVSFADSQQWWRTSGPIFETLPPGMLLGASTNEREIYRVRPNRQKKPPTTTLLDFLRAV